MYGYVQISAHLCMWSICHLYDAHISEILLEILLSKKVSEATNHEASVLLHCNTASHP